MITGIFVSLMTNGAFADEGHGLLSGVIRNVNVSSPAKFYIRAVEAGGQTDSQAVAVGPTGTFQIANLHPGTYRLCVQSIGPDIVDPCKWPTDSKTYSIKAGEHTQVGEISLERGVRLRVLVDGAQEHGATLDDRQAGPALLVGVWTANGTFEPLRNRGRTASGWLYDTIVPYETPVNITADSYNLALGVDRGIGVETADGVRCTAILHRERQANPIHVHVTGMRGVHDK